MEKLFDEAYEMLNRHQNEETEMTKRMYEAVRDLLCEVGGCVQLEKRNSLVYNSGSYGKMYVTKLAMCGSVMMAYCEGEKYSLWWSKPVEPWYACFVRFISIMRQLKDKTFCPIENPLKDERPEWHICV